MEFVKHNQLLKIRVSYDQDNGYYFQASAKLASVSGLILSI